MDNGVGYHRILNDPSDPRISILASQFKISMIHEQVELKSPARMKYFFYFEILEYAFPMFMYDNGIIE